MKKQFWSPLCEGDVVDIIAPGYATDLKQVEEAKKFLLKWNLIPRVPNDLIVPHFLHSNDDENRAKFLVNALQNSDSKMVWCLRGGYGSNRLLPYLSKIKKPKNSKLLLGISDITSLHVFLNQQWHWVSVHGPLLDRTASGKLPPRLLSETKKMLFGETDEIVFQKLKPMNSLARESKSISGEIIGGNLIVLQSTLGTPWQVDTSGKFLFIEELCERGYKVDRALEQFRQAGLFKKCKGLIIGDFIGGEEANGKLLWPLVLKRFAQDLSIPVWNGFEAGHGVVQRPVPFGTKAVLKTTNKNEVKLTIPTGVSK